MGEQQRLRDACSRGEDSEGVSIDDVVDQGDDRERRDNGERYQSGPAMGKEPRPRETASSNARVGALVGAH